MDVVLQSRCNARTQSQGTLESFIMGSVLSAVSLERMELGAGFVRHAKDVMRYRADSLHVLDMLKVPN